MFLINAIHFKGDWTQRFDPGKTADEMFTTVVGTPASCRMMRLQHDFSYFENESFQAILFMGKIATPEL